MPGEERDRLRQIVAEAHERGQRVRFWSTPDLPGVNAEAVWSELLAAGVDFFNTDHLPELQQFLLEHDPQPSEPGVAWWPPH